MGEKHFRRGSPTIELLEGRVLLSAAGATVQPGLALIQRAATPDVTPSGITPAQMQQAYGINSIKFGSIAGTGAGQTIAIIDVQNDPKLSSDLAQFDSYYGLPAPPGFVQLNQSGGTQLPPNAPLGQQGIEQALEAEWTHAIAPQANLILYEANSFSDSDIETAIATAASNPSVTVVTMPFIGSEYAGETALDPSFTSRHVTFLAQTGNQGSPAAYPAASPNVIAVGGTVLTLNSSGARASETTWSSTGGGPSMYEAQPAYQNSLPGPRVRQTPDVSMDAGTAVPIYDSYDSSTAPWSAVSGTLLASQMWGGLIAIANQGRVINGLPVFNTINNPPANDTAEALPLLYQAGRTSGYFHDITTGNNGTYSAAIGYDEVTGWGTPVANVLIPYLASTYVKVPVGITLAGPGPNPSNATEPLSFTATVTGGIPDGQPLSLEDASVGNKVIATGTVSNGSAAFNVPAGTLLAGMHNLVATYGGDTTFAPGQSVPYTQTVQVAATSLAINGNLPSLAGAQRSMVDSLVYSFSEPVTLSQGAFSIAVQSGHTGTAPSLSWSAIDPDSAGASPRWVVSFSGAGVVNNSIADGTYEITLNPSAVASEANQLGPVASRPADAFLRLFGDIDGNGIVNNIDYFQFNHRAFNRKFMDPAYVAAFDYNGDGIINNSDFFQFNKRFGHTI